MATFPSADFSQGPPGESISDRIVAVLQRRILAGEIPIGAWLRHGALAEEFGISRTPVREALRILNAQGIVTIDLHRGARVNGHSGKDIREIGAVRAELEGYAAELATERINDAQLKRMQEAWQGFGELIQQFDGTEEDQQRQAQQWAESNHAFHSVIVEASGNHQLELTIAELRRRLPHNLSYAAYAGNARLLRRNLEQHEGIAAAIIGHNARLARKLMTAHLRASNEATARWVENRGSRV
ncbi:GntR family transcriptional regulator [Acrocarpospora sp. B8E8]|uniref:GntR family transcriptional regulator n=1 Tax=Acrocarpospora sp. B8E8 TaxID=3153572 RepID=UPI00325EA8EE